jgi:hypothetical protein
VRAAAVFDHPCAPAQGDGAQGRSDGYEVIFQKFKSSSKKEHGQLILQLCYVSQQESNGQPDVKRARRPAAMRSSFMKRCAQCHKKLGLGVRFRNVWNGHWWAHVRFCSVRCEAIYEAKRNDAVKHRWHDFLARGSSPS